MFLLKWKKKSDTWHIEKKKNQTCSAVWTWLAAKSSGTCLKKNVEHGKKPTMNCKTLNWNKGTEYLETAEQDKGGSKTAEHAQSAYTQGNANQKLTIIQQAQKGQCKMSVQRRLEDNMAQLKWFWVQILLITLQVLWSSVDLFLMTDLFCIDLHWPKYCRAVMRNWMEVVKLGQLVIMKSGVGPLFDWPSAFASHFESVWMTPFQFIPSSKSQNKV